MEATARPTLAVVRARMLDAELLPVSDAVARALVESTPALWSVEEFAFEPQFFLASVSPAQWTPRIVVVRENGRVRGFVYTKERKVANLHTGVLYTDGSIVSSVIANQADRVDVLHTALHFLFSRLRVRALRMLLPLEGPESKVLQQALASLDVDVFRADWATKHSRLPLPRTYELFLHRLGHRTRKNFRYYRRRFEAAAGSYVERLSLDEFTRAAGALTRKSHIPVNPENLERFSRMLGVVERPLMAGLRGPDGQWMAILGGWHGGRSSMIFLQLNNDRERPRDSLSVVLRGYVIESLIAQGIQEIVFWAGSSAPLAWHCTSIPAVALYLDTRTGPWRYFRYAAARIGSWFPKFRDAAWIAPRRVPSATAQRVDRELVDIDSPR